MKRKPTFSPSIGSISGLDPDEDPIGDLAYELRKLLEKCRVDRETRKAHLKLLAECEKISADFGNEHPVPHKLVEALSHYAPPYTYFGEREGEYGFWPELDNDLPRIEAGHESGHPGFWGNEVMLVTDHGNVNCGRFDKRGRWHEYWSCV